MEQLSNPAAIATIASSKQGQAFIGDALNAAKWALLIGGVVLTGRYVYGEYKDYRADKYARDNVGDPNLIAASIIYESFTRIGFPEASFLSWIIPEMDISTNENALNNIANQVTNVKAVSDAYKILFDRTLSKDLQNGLDTEELQTFWNLINSSQVNNDTSIYPIGSLLYVASRQGITVNKAIEDQNGYWIGTGDLYRNLERNELVGEVIAHGKVTQNMIDINGDANLVGQNYYIVKEVRFNQCLTNCKVGVVVQEQVTNTQV